MNRILKTLILLSIVINCFSQSALNSILLDSLEEKLYLEKSDQIRAITILNCDRHDVDSSHLIRRCQPDVDICLDILNRILLNNDSKDFYRLLDLYQRHIILFDQDWGAYYKKREKTCDFANNQSKILTGFEIVLRSLEIKKDNWSDIDIYNSIIDLVRWSEKFKYQFRERDSLLEEYKVYSPIFKELKRRRWFADGVFFSYVDPYREEIKPHFINLLESCHWDKEISESCHLVSMCIGVYSIIDDPKVKDYFIKNYDLWTDHYRAVFIFKYAEKYHYPDLTQFLTRAILNDSRLRGEKVDPRNYLFKLMMHNQLNRPLIKRTLLKELKPQLENHNTLPLVFIKFFPDIEVTNELFKILDSSDLSPQEKMKVKETLGTFLESKELTKKLKKAIRRKIK